MKRNNSGNCALCNIFRKHLHRDHIKPKSLGGSEEKQNIQYICANCHEDKTAVDMIEISKMTWKNPERKIKQHESLKRSWMVPGARERRGKARSELLRNSEMIQKLTESNIKTWSDPIKRAEHSETMTLAWKKRKQNEN